jgi:predicted DNA binding protein
MRYLEGTLRPERGYFHEFDQVVRAEPSIAAEAIHQLTLMEDETLVLLYELDGAPAAVESFLDKHFEAITYQTSKMGENRLVYAHIKPSPIVSNLVQVPQRSGIVIDYPMVFLDEGSLRVRLVGEESALQRAVSELSAIVQVDIKRLGRYAPETERLFVQLTDRQQEILLTAVEAGYYDVPKGATYQDIADMIGLTVATVGEHLHKIESTVFRDITSTHRNLSARE